MPITPEDRQIDGRARRSARAVRGLPTTCFTDLHRHLVSEDQVNLSVSNC